MKLSCPHFSYIKTFFNIIKNNYIAFKKEIQYNQMNFLFDKKLYNDLKYKCYKKYFFHTLKEIKNIKTYELVNSTICNIKGSSYTPKPSGFQLDNKLKDIRELAVQNFKSKFNKNNTNSEIENFSEPCNIKHEYDVISQILSNKIENDPWNNTARN